MVIDTGRARELPKIIDELARLAAERARARARRGPDGRRRSPTRSATASRRRCPRPPGVRSTSRWSSTPRSSAAWSRASATSSSTARSRAASRTPNTHSGAEADMALNLDPASIAEALRKNVESWTPSVEREEVGRVIETGDGIARVAGLPRTMANELLEFPGGLLGVAFNLDEARDRLHHLRRRRRHRGGRPGQADRAHPLGPGRRRVPRPGRRRPGPPARRQGRDRGRGERGRSSCRRPTWSRASR